MRDPSPIAANDDSPVEQLRALRSDLEADGLPDYANRAYRIEQSLQRRMTVHEAAVLTGETPGAIYKAIARGRLDADTEGTGNRLLIVTSNLLIWNQRPGRRSADGP